MNHSNLAIKKQSLAKGIVGIGGCLLFSRVVEYVGEVVAKATGKFLQDKVYDIILKPLWEYIVSIVSLIPNFWGFAREVSWGLLCAVFMDVVVMSLFVVLLSIKHRPEERSNFEGKTRMEVYWDVLTFIFGLRESECRHIILAMHLVCVALFFSFGWTDGFFSITLLK